MQLRSHARCTEHFPFCILYAGACTALRLHRLASAQLPMRVALRRLSSSDMTCCLMARHPPASRRMPLAHSPQPMQCAWPCPRVNTASRRKAQSSIGGWSNHLASAAGQLSNDVVWAPYTQAHCLSSRASMPSTCSGPLPCGARARRSVGTKPPAVAEHLRRLVARRTHACTNTRISGSYTRRSACSSDSASIGSTRATARACRRDAQFANAAAM